MEIYEQHDSHPPPQHLFCPQPQQLGQQSGGPTSGIWCERCGQARHEAKVCAAREPRRFNGLCDICCELGHLSCDCLLQRDRIYSDVPTLSSPPQNNHSGRGGTGYDLPISPPSYSGRSGGLGYDIPGSPPQYSGSHYYRAKPFVRHYSGGDGRRSSSQPPAPSLALAGTRGTTAATVQGRSSSQASALSLALAGTRGATAATVQRRSSSQVPALSPALAGTRGTTAATVQCHSSSQASAPSLALAGTRGITAATVQRRSSSQAPAPSLALAGSRGTLAIIDRR